MTTVQDLLSLGIPLGDDDYSRVEGSTTVDDRGGVTKDLKTISSIIADKERRMGTDEWVESEKSTTTAGDDDDSDRDVDIDLTYTEFTSFPTEPSNTRLRRVNAMKRRWEDPDYRERWYHKRWGARKRKKETQTDLERKAIQRARVLPSGFLGSDELASLSEEEIAEAIRARIKSTRKRVAKRKQTLQGRKEFLAAQMTALDAASDRYNGDNDDDDDYLDDEDSKLQNLSRDVLFAPDTTKLEEAKRKRSERAKRLYAIRLKNQKVQNENQTAEELSSSSSKSSSSFSSSKTKSSPRNKGPYFPPKQQTPQDAFLRIENDLDRGATPAIDDVRLILEPGKMKNRKPLLGRILLDEFNLRGKCVPPVVANVDGEGLSDDAIVIVNEDRNGYDENELEFVQRCTIERLGIFIIRLLNRDNSIE